MTTSPNPAEKSNPDDANPFIDSKPSPAHIIWQEKTNTGKKKHFDFQQLRFWAAQFSLSYTERRRVDGERAAAPRDQHVIIFAEEEPYTEAISVGEETWSLAPQSTPRTFLEIDEAGAARVQGWEKSMCYNIVELIVDGPSVVYRTVDGDTHELEIQQFKRQNG
jgi:hypothetical protein